MLESSYQSQISLKESIRQTLLTRTILLHVCKGDRPGGPFLQKEAWEAVKIAQKSTVRAVLRVHDDPQFMR